MHGQSPQGAVHLEGTFRIATWGGRGTESLVGPVKVASETLSPVLAIKYLENGILRMGTVRGEGFTRALLQELAKVGVMGAG